MVPGEERTILIKKLLSYLVICKRVPILNALASVELAYLQPIPTKVLRQASTTSSRIQSTYTPAPTLSQWDTSYLLTECEVVVNLVALLTFFHMLTAGVLRRC